MYDVLHDGHGTICKAVAVGITVLQASASSSSALSPATNAKMASSMLPALRLAARGALRPHVHAPIPHRRPWRPPRGCLAPPARHLLSAPAPPKPEPGPGLGPGPEPEPSNWNAANYLTAARLAAAPGVAALILADAHGLALAAVAAAGATDAADGYVARRYALRTTLGSYLDPAADKALAACAFGALAAAGTLPAWVACVVVGRDAVLVAAAVGRGWARRGGGAALAPLPVQPLAVSKINTGLQVALIAAGIAHGAGGYGVVTQPLVDGLCVATAGTTAASLGGYAARFWKA